MEHLPHVKPDNDPTDRTVDEEPPSRKRRESQKLFSVSDLSSASISHFSTILGYDPREYSTHMSVLSGEGTVPPPSGIYVTDLRSNEFVLSPVVRNGVTFMERISYSQRDFDKHIEVIQRSIDNESWHVFYRVRW